MARTHVARLLEFLATNEGKATVAEVQERFGWSTDKIDSVIHASTVRIKRANVGSAPGIAQVGIEIGARGAVPLYSDVRRVLAST